MPDEAKRVPPRCCPVCGKPATPAQRPFCSERCRQVDLGRWLSDNYAIPGEPEVDDGEPNGG